MLLIAYKVHGLTRNEGHDKQFRLRKFQLLFPKPCLRKILDDYTSDHETLLEKDKFSTINVKRMRILATEIFKTINNLNHCRLLS